MLAASEMAPSVNKIQFPRLQPIDIAISDMKVYRIVKKMSARLCELAPSTVVSSLNLADIS